MLFTYLHLAADRPQMDALLAGNVKSVAYETIAERDGSLPLLAPMSQIAGRLSLQEGAKYLEKTFGGEGVLLAGVPGAPRANVVIIGGGSVGANAAKIAVGMGANVTVLDISLKRLEQLDDMFGGRVQTLYSTDANIERAVKDAREDGVGRAERKRAGEQRRRVGYAHRHKEHPAGGARADRR